ncbi:MAG TPA: cupin domain-containing protein [Pyrinomonadaceae bacterium]|nr:cupin domain-containing protein [Pyrinomonadaceae bacterium]
MPEVEWTTVEEAPVKEKFGGAVRVRTLWPSDSGAVAQFVEIDAGGCWEGVDLHEPGPEEVFVVSGVFNDGVRDYPAGSFIHNPAGSSHVPQSKTGCTLFVFYPEG